MPTALCQSSGLTHQRAEESDLVEYYVTGFVAGAKALALGKLGEEKAKEKFLA